MPGRADGAADRRTEFFGAAAGSVVNSGSLQRGIARPVGWWPRRQRSGRDASASTDRVGFTGGNLAITNAETLSGGAGAEPYRIAG